MAQDVSNLIISGSTRMVAILADPIAHVRTPQMMNALFARRGIDAVTVPMHVSADDLPVLWNGLTRTRNFAGVVVTMPHKGSVAGLCDRLGENASLAGAVNVVRFDPDGSTEGEAFDGAGFVAGYRAQGFPLRGQRVLIIGAGGAASAIAFAIARELPASLTIANRDEGKAITLADRVAAINPGVEVSAGSADPTGHSVIVNATSLGLRPNDPLPVPADRLERGMIVAEVIMQPERTALLENASAAGCFILEGRHMLAGQVEQFVSFLRL